MCSVDEEVTRSKIRLLLLKLSSEQITDLENIGLALKDTTELEIEGGKLLDQLVTILDDGKPKELIGLLSKTGEAGAGDGASPLQALETELRPAGAKQLLHLFKVVEATPSLLVLLDQRGEYLSA